MKAVVYNRYGPPEVLKLKTVDRPMPGNKEVLIKVHAVEVTKADCELRSFRFPVKWFSWPLRLAMGIRRPRRPVLGGYFAGEVVDMGKDVSGYAKGEYIFGCAKLRMGAYAEYMCLPDHYTMVPLPHNMSFAQAAAVLLGGLNALHFLTKAKIQPGERVLINGAGGSIGIAAVQIAKDQGAEVTVVDHNSKEKMLRSIGAGHFIDYENADFTRGGQKYDVILSMVAGSSYSGIINTLRSNGRYLMANPRLSDMFRAMITTFFTDKSVTFAFAPEKRKELLKLKEMIEAGRLTSVLDKIYCLDQIVEAHHRVEKELRIGSVVLSPTGIDTNL